MANDRFQAVHCGPSDRGIRADGIGPRSGNRYSRSLQLQLVQLIAQFFLVLIVPTKDWDFKTVESSRFDHFQMAIVLLSYMSSPEQKVHADLHSFWGDGRGMVPGHQVSESIAVLKQDSNCSSNDIFSDQKRLLCLPPRWPLQWDKV